MADKLEVKEKDNKSDTIAGSEISLTYKENDDIKQALKKQNGFLWPAAFFSKNSAKVTVEVSYDQSALDSKIQSLQAVTAEQVPAQSAYPKFDGREVCHRTGSDRHRSKYGRAEGKGAPVYFRVSDGTGYGKGKMLCRAKIYLRVRGSKKGMRYHE